MLTHTEIDKDCINLKKKNKIDKMWIARVAFNVGFTDVSPPSQKEERKSKPFHAARYRVLLLFNSDISIVMTTTDSGD